MQKEAYTGEGRDDFIIFVKKICCIVLVAKFKMVPYKGTLKLKSCVNL